MKFFFLTFLLLWNCTHTKLFALESESIGDALLLILPSVSYGSTFYTDDAKGRTMFYKSCATNVATTLALKYSVNKTRPNGEKHSFPSAHSSITFQSASFIHLRYGFKYAIIPYIGALFTAYSRVISDQHYSSDVIAGAFIGSLSSYIFTDSYKGWELKAFTQKQTYGILLSRSW